MTYRVPEAREVEVHVGADGRWRLYRVRAEGRLSVLTAVPAGERAAPVEGSGGLPVAIKGLRAWVAAEGLSG